MPEDWAYALRLIRITIPTFVVCRADYVDTGSHADSYERNSSRVQELACIRIGTIALRLVRITTMMCRAECFDISSYTGSYERNCSRVHELARL